MENKNDIGIQSSFKETHNELLVSNEHVTIQREVGGASASENILVDDQPNAKAGEFSMLTNNSLQTCLFHLEKILMGGNPAELEQRLHSYKLLEEYASTFKSMQHENDQLKLALASCQNQNQELEEEKSRLVEYVELLITEVNNRAIQQPELQTAPNNDNQQETMGTKGNVENSLELHEQLKKKEEVIEELISERKQIVGQAYDERMEFICANASKQNEILRLEAIVKELQEEKIKQGGLGTAQVKIDLDAVNVSSREPARKKRKANDSSGPSSQPASSAA